MHLSKAALSLLVWIGCSGSFQSAIAFSSPSFVSPSRTAQRAQLGSVRPTETAPLRMVASAEPISVADMKRGIGGRLEDAFASAKERGEAAFVTFVTAGYPRAEG